MRKPSTCLLVALLGGALLAGCGSGSKSGTEANTTSTQSGGASSATGTASSENLKSTSTGRSPLTAKEQVEACKQNVQTLSTLSASAKARLQKTCEKVGVSSAGQRQVVHEVCRELASRLPAGAARERALAICRAP